MADKGNTSQTVAPTLYARLACACNCAYGISSKDGVYTPPPVYHPGTGWKTSPVAFSAPKTDSRINACLVGLNQDGIIVAFRGTLPPAWTVASLEDWWQDIVDSEPIAAPPLTGKVHEGFWDALQSIWNGVLGEIKALQSAHPGVPIYLTGHSKGGPLASIGAALLSLSASIQAREVVTFASPHPGNGDFVTNYPAGIPVTRFENYLDIVPFLPPTDIFYKLVSSIIPTSWKQEFCSWFPSLCKALENAAAWNYQPLGVLHYITRNGTVVNADNPDANTDLRLLQILLELFGLDPQSYALQDAADLPTASLSDTGLTRIGAAHCIACRHDQEPFCAGGYMTGAGGNPICPAP
jgi:hypothetical protein